MSAKHHISALVLALASTSACDDSNGLQKSTEPGNNTPDSAAPDPSASGGSSNSNGGSGSVVGTGSGSGTDAGSNTVTGEPPDCETLPGRVCSKLADCNEFRFLQNYGDAATCETRLAAACAALSTPGVLLDMQQCAAAAAQPHCQGWVAGDVPSPCITPLGMVEPGAECGAHQDCRSGYCNMKEACGVCVARVGEGSPCADALECEVGLACTPNGCVAPAVAGAACSASQPCAEPLVCTDGTCAALGAAGSTCGLAQACDATKGLGCSGGTCTKRGTAAVGEACSVGTLCIRGSKCLANGDDGGRTCQAGVELGEQCSDALPCAPPFRCVGGVCAVLDPGRCAM